MFSVQRLEMYLRAKRLLAEARDEPRLLNAYSFPVSSGTAWNRSATRP